MMMSNHEQKVGFFLLPRSTASLFCLTALTFQLLLLLLTPPPVNCWEVAERGDPFEDERFKKILTISCHQNETYPWGCPENSDCVPGPLLNFCLCQTEYINPDPYRYGHVENVTVRVVYVDEEEGGGGSDADGEGANNGEPDSGDDEDDKLVEAALNGTLPTVEVDVDDDDNGESDGDDEYAGEGRCLHRTEVKTKQLIKDDDPRWSILNVPCTKACPEYSECRNGKDCVCFEGFYGDPKDNYESCIGRAGRLQLGFVSVLVCILSVIITALLE